MARSDTGGPSCGERRLQRSTQCLTIGAFGEAGPQAPLARVIGVEARLPRMGVGAQVEAL